MKTRAPDIVNRSCQKAQVTMAEATNGVFLNFSEAQRKEFWAALAFKYTQGLGARSAALLVQTFGSAFAAVQKLEQWRRRGISEQVVEQFKAEEWRTLAGEEWSRAKDAIDQNILLWTNPYYPHLLRNIPDAPIFLYYQGNLELLTGPGVAVVGARSCSADGLAASRRASYELSKAGITVISGLAKGVDREAHEVALEGPGSSIAVLGCGLDVYYPRENMQLQKKMAQSGLVLTEYSVGVKPEAFHFPIRNRIISAISLGVLVVEAAAKSGSLITARMALDYGREVFAVPGKFAAGKAMGCHDLIRKGAKPVFDVDDLLVELLPRLSSYTNFSRQALNLSEKSGIVFEDKKNVLKQTKTQAPANNDVDLSPLSNSISKNKRIKSDNNKYPTVKSMNAAELANAIFSLLESEGPLQADSICAHLKISAAKISSQLLLLELEGRVKRYPGMIYGIQ